MNVNPLFLEENTLFYPIELEKSLCSLIGNHDREGAQATLNDLLGYIYISNNFELAGIKARVIELVVLLSRAAIDAGADVGEIFEQNRQYFCQIERFTTVEEFSIWLTEILHRFISYSFNFTRMKHSDVVYRVMEYVKVNYRRRITLDELAKHIYLSRSYLSSIFKEETGMNLSSFINAVRVEKSKALLLDNTVRLVDVANLCGFEDQSYYTKVFKRVVGVSPKRYRDCRGKTPPSQLPSGAQKINSLGG